VLIEEGRLSPFGSGAFRFAFLLAAVFAIGSALLLAVVQRQVGRYAVEATSATLRSEAAILTGEYRSMGLPGLIDAMNRHQQAAGEPQFRYLLLDAKGRQLFGDLPGAAASVGWGELRLREPPSNGEEDDTEVLERLGKRLPDGLLLVVATDTFDVQSLRARLFWFTLYSGLGITLFALAGGFGVGRLFLRRLEQVNAAVGRIMDGSVAERLPAIGLSPEFDRLSSNLNRMLDRNAALMEGLRQVSTDIAHDLRTPLTRLYQQLQRMRDEDGAEDRASGIDDALAQTESLLGIFQALLRIGALEGGVGRQRFTQVDLSEVMDRVHLAYKPVAEDSGHVLVAEHDPGIVVIGDADLLAQLFTNLIENALVHTPPGTHVVTGLRATGTDVLAEVRDDGPGIPVSERDKVFRRFYRCDASRNTPGAGLGLSLVAAIAALHEATVSLTDSTPGLRVGITFAGPDLGEAEEALRRAVPNTSRSNSWKGRM
jgi:signal transduction histidine kinase